jgi:hypothetical protein
MYVHIEPEPPEHARGLSFRDTPEYQCEYWDVEVPRMPRDCTFGELRAALATLLRCDAKQVVYTDRVAEEHDDMTVEYGVKTVRPHPAFVRPETARVVVEKRGGGILRWATPTMLCDNRMPRILKSVTVPAYEVGADGRVLADRLPPTPVDSYGSVGGNTPDEFARNVARASWVVPRGLEILRYDADRHRLIVCRTETLKRLVETRLAPRKAAQEASLAARNKETRDWFKAMADRADATGAE